MFNIINLRKIIIISLIICLSTIIVSLPLSLIYEKSEKDYQNNIKTNEKNDENVDEYGVKKKLKKNNNESLKYENDENQKSSYNLFLILLINGIASCLLFYIVQIFSDRILNKNTNSKMKRSQNYAFLNKLSKYITNINDRDFILFLASIESSNLQNIIKNENKIYLNNWDKYVKKTIIILINEDKQTFENISSELLNKISKNNWVENIVNKNEHYNNEIILQRLDNCKIELEKCKINFEEIKNKPISMFDASKTLCDLTMDIIGNGFQFSDVFYSESASEGDENKVINYPVFQVNVPSLIWQYLPIDIIEKLFFISLKTGNNKKLHEVIEDLKQYGDFFSSLIAGKECFFDYLNLYYYKDGKYNINSLEHKNWLYENMINMLKKMGISSLVVNNDINKLLNNENSNYFNEIIETFNFKFIDSIDINGYPYCKTKIPVVFNEKYIIFNELYITEYLNNNDLIDSKLFKKNEIDILKYILSEQFDDNINHTEYQKYIINSNILEIMYNIYDMQLSDNRCYNFIYNKAFNGRGYELINPNNIEIEKISEEMNIEYELTGDKSLNEKIKNKSFGLKKEKNIIFKPNCICYKYDATISLNKYLEFLDSITASGNAINIIKALKIFINSLLSNIKIINKILLSVYDNKKKKEWFLLNNTLSFLFEKDIDIEMNKILKEFSLDNQLMTKKDDFENYNQLFIDDWKKIIEDLKNNGIKRIEIIPEKTIVTKNNLEKGWGVKNTEKKYTNKADEDLLVYGIIQHGIEVEGMIIREPIVNTYSYRD